MERLKFIAMAFVASLALLSCGGDDDDPAPEPQPPTPVTPIGVDSTTDTTTDQPAYSRQKDRE